MRKSSRTNVPNWTKIMLVKLHGIGLSSERLAKLSGLRKMQIASYVAWNTMRNGRKRNQ